MPASRPAGIRTLFDFFMRGRFFAPLAELLQFQLRLDCFLIALRLVIDVLTHRALHFYEIVL